MLDPNVVECVQWLPADDKLALRDELRRLGTSDDQAAATHVLEMGILEALLGELPLTEGIEKSKAFVARYA